MPDLPSGIGGIGGCFGGKLFIRADAVLAALGAKAARRPVKLALQRPLIANNTTHRPATIQRIRIGAGREIAYGVLEMGGTARQAVEIACKRLDLCGGGVDELSPVG